VPGPVLIAPDKFKGSLSAAEVADALAAGLPGIEVRRTPVADGGDGTVAAALAAGYKRVPVRVTGPVGTPLSTEIAVSGDTAVVELAAASGLALLPSVELAPMTASSFGTGELIRAALDAGARRIVLGVGGSACTDGGAGMIAALGARLLADAGRPLPPGGGGLVELSEVDLGGLDPRIAETEIVLASDVDNPLLGENGAAHVYGPQKGADPTQVRLLDAALRSWSRAVTRAGGEDVAGAEGAGAAGGVGYAAMAVLGAKQRSGAELVLELVGFDAALPGSALVITGEGALDEQTLHGKAPSVVAARAAAAGIPVIAVTGRCALPMDRIREEGFADVHALTEVDPDPQVCIRDAARLLPQLAGRIAAKWL